ncbi:MAG TPA: hypothetical protein VGO48_09965 [Conexibacter sp.]|jgi:hypothetical protein|nr:hypothetical protein [Conexibacter sp.]
MRPEGASFSIERKARLTMRHAPKLALAALFAAAALAGLVSSASARNLSSSSESFRVVWNPLTFEDGTLAIRCVITLEGTFHSRTIAKVDGALMGYITRATVRHGCTEPFSIFSADAWTYNGSEVSLGATLANSLPWHVTYKGFSGTLPNIGRIRILTHGVRFVFRVTSSGCLGTYGGESVNLIWEANLAAGRITSFGPEAGAALETTAANCPSPLLFSGAGAVTVLNAATAITIRLI